MATTGFSGTRLVEGVIGKLDRFHRQRHEQQLVLVGDDCEGFWTDLRRTLLFFVTWAVLHGDHHAHQKRRAHPDPFFTQE